MEVIKCRTCLKLTYKHDCIEINTECYLEETVKQAIVRLIPEMISTLQEDDMVCKNCSTILKVSLKFIQNCLAVEDLIACNKNISNTVIEVPELDIKVEDIENILSQIDFDHSYYFKQDLKNTTNIFSEDDDDKNDLSFSERIITETDSLVDTDTYSSDNTIDNANPSIEIIIEEPSSPESNFEEPSVTLDNPEVMKKNPDDFTCPICSLKFPDNVQYEAHIEGHVLSCEFCGKEFSDGQETDYKVHMDEHEKVIKVCEFCGIIMQDAKSLRKHIFSKHEAVPIICDQCPKSFPDKYQVNLHVKTVHQKAKRRQCTACGKFFVNLDTCKNHYKLVHLNLKPYLCAICGKKFGRSDYLERHKAEHGLPVNIKKPISRNPRKRMPKRIPKHGVHLKDPGKPVKCNVCGKQIATVHLLKGHLESHVKIRRFKCKYCDLTFSMSNNKKRHERSHEKDSQNKYRCNICWKRVKTEDELEAHIMSHDRPPQHSCDICGERFHRKYLLENHIAEKHISEEDIEKAMEEIVVKNLLEYANPNIL